MGSGVEHSTPAMALRAQSPESKGQAFYWLITCYPESKGQAFYWLIT